MLLTIVKEGINPYKTEIFFYKLWRQKGYHVYYQFEVIINVLS